MTCSVFTELCNRRHYQISDLFNHLPPKETSYPLAVASHPLLPYSLSATTDLDPVSKNFLYLHIFPFIYFLPTCLLGKKKFQDECWHHLKKISKFWGQSFNMSSSCDMAARGNNNDDTVDCCWQRWRCCFSWESQPLGELLNVYGFSLIGKVGADLPEWSLRTPGSKLLFCASESTRSSAHSSGSGTDQLVHIRRTENKWPDGEGPEAWADETGMLLRRKEGDGGIRALPGSIISWVRRQMDSMGLKGQKHDQWKKFPINTRETLQ